MTTALFSLRAIQTGIPLEFFPEMTIGEILDIFAENAADYGQEAQASLLSGQEAVNLLTGGGAFRGDD